MRLRRRRSIVEPPARMPVIRLGESEGRIEHTKVTYPECGHMTGCEGTLREAIAAVEDGYGTRWGLCPECWHVVHIEPGTDRAIQSHYRLDTLACIEAGCP